MVRPKVKKRFSVLKESKSYWIIYDGERIAGYVSRGTGRKCYFCNKKHQVLGDNFTGMKLVYDNFISYLLVFDG
jgi:hypothetical protein